MGPDTRRLKKKADLWAVDPATPAHVVLGLFGDTLLAQRFVVDVAPQGGEPALAVQTIGPAWDHHHVDADTPWGEVALHRGRPRLRPTLRHHSEVEVRERVPPEHPDGVEASADRCRAKVYVDALGVPYDVEVSGCPFAYAQRTEAALLQWRFYPTPLRAPQPFLSVIAVTFTP